MLTIQEWRRFAREVEKCIRTVYPLNYIPASKLNDAKKLIFDQNLIFQCFLFQQFVTHQH